ncbi:MAG: hypothetical protein EOP51_29615 [Sphingobacteriales bacterium]|nr:MAG: hypothetical protein EOP51_29615 [Sphingobacteriales bacterium]
MELSGLDDIISWIYIAIFPVFYLLIYFVGNLTYRSSSINFIKVFVLNSFVLYLLLAVNLSFVVVPYEEYTDEYIVLGSIVSCSYLLSLMIYLKMLSAQDDVTVPADEKPEKVISHNTHELAG